VPLRYEIQVEALSKKAQQVFGSNHLRSASVACMVAIFWHFSVAFFDVQLGSKFELDSASDPQPHSRVQPHGQ
jgi:hypothetical protein